jgi:hypothetical protein
MTSLPRNQEMRVHSQVRERLNIDEQIARISIATFHSERRCLTESVWLARFAGRKMEYQPSFYPQQMEGGSSRVGAPETGVGYDPNPLPRGWM